jgi:hypothetical protein
MKYFHFKRSLIIRSYNLTSFIMKLFHFVWKTALFYRPPVGSLKKKLPSLFPTWKTLNTHAVQFVEAISHITSENGGPPRLLNIGTLPLHHQDYSVRGALNVENKAAFSWPTVER